MKQQQIVGAGLLLSLLLCGCSTIDMHRDRPEYSIGVVLKAQNSPYWLDMSSGMQQAATDYGIDMTLLYPEGEQEGEEQKSLIADILDSDVDLMMVAPCDSYDTEWFIEKAKMQDIDVLTVDTRAMDAELPYIGSDNVLFGKMVAEYFNERLKPGSTILLLYGPEKQSSIIERDQAIREYLDSDIHIQGVQYTELDEENGYLLIQQLEQPVDGIYCQNAVLARGVVEALTEKDWNSKVISVDTEDDAVQLLKDGAMDAMVIQNGYEIGYQSIELALETLRSGEQPEDMLFDGELLTVQDTGGN
ncbi:MAG: substrate-binding domain-containing protein [Eubacteriales bacterium]|nr:substrate-binding domain-containing protein [Eubacteriales bacterium]